MQERPPHMVCLFYKDNVCRNKKAGNCYNCAKEKYSELYRLNWENCDNLQNEIDKKEKALQKIKQVLLTAEYSHEDKPIHKDSILATEILEIIAESE